MKFSEFCKSSGKCLTMCEILQKILFLQYFVSKVSAYLRCYGEFLKIFAEYVNLLSGYWKCHLTFDKIQVNLVNRFSQFQKAFYRHHRFWYSRERASWSLRLDGSDSTSSGAPRREEKRQLVKLWFRNVFPRPLSLAEHCGNFERRAHDNTSFSLLCTARRSGTTTINSPNFCLGSFCWARIAFLCSQFYDELSSLDSCHDVASFSSGQVGVKFKRFVSIESDRRKKLRCKATPRCWATSDKANTKYFHWCSRPIRTARFDGSTFCGLVAARRRLEPRSVSVVDSCLSVFTTFTSDFEHVSLSRFLAGEGGL